jgi:excisionase family DNA binding protein
MNILTTRAAATILGISIRQVQTLIQRGKLPAEKIGRDYFIKDSDLKLVEQRQVGRPSKQKQLEEKS